MTEGGLDDVDGKPWIVAIDSARLYFEIGYRDANVTLTGRVNAVINDE